MGGFFKKKDTRLQIPPVKFQPVEWTGEEFYAPPLPQTMETKACPLMLEHGLVKDWNREASE